MAQVVSKLCLRLCWCARVKNAMVSAKDPHFLSPFGVLVVVCVCTTGPLVLSLLLLCCEIGPARNYALQPRQSRLQLCYRLYEYYSYRTRILSAPRCSIEHGHALSSRRESCVELLRQTFNCAECLVKSAVKGCSQKGHDSTSTTAVVLLPVLYC